jgi:hypothetical protein
VRNLGGRPIDNVAIEGYIFSRPRNPVEIVINTKYCQAHLLIAVIR